MKFVNKGKDQKIRFEKTGNSYRWMTLRTGEVINLPEKVGLAYGLSEVKDEKFIKAEAKRLEAEEKARVRDKAKRLEAEEKRAKAEAERLEEEAEKAEAKKVKEEEDKANRLEASK